MSLIEKVITRTRRIEKLLQELGGVGKGMHEKATSISAYLPQTLEKRVRFIASVRNKLMHTDGYSFDGDQEQFLLKCDSVIDELSALVESTRISKAITLSVVVSAPPELPRIVHAVPSTAAVSPVSSASETSKQDESTLSNVQSERKVVEGKSTQTIAPASSTKPEIKANYGRFICVLVSVILCLILLPKACTHRERIVVSKGFFWDDTKDVDAVSWWVVGSLTVLCGWIVYVIFPKRR